jgi:hypothetical protein
MSNVKIRPFHPLPSTLGMSRKRDHVTEYAALGSSITQYEWPVAKGRPRGTTRVPLGLRIIQSFSFRDRNASIDALPAPPIITTRARPIARI